MERVKEMSFSEMEKIQGGSFCGGFGAAVGLYGLGVLANWWDPIGWVGTVVIAGVSIYCISS